jgi:hypothetical protein
MNNEDKILDDQFIKKPKQNKISITFCSICILTGLLGYIFHVMHWPGATLLVSFGFGSFCGYLIAKTLFIKKPAKIILLNFIALIISTLLIIRYQNYLIVIFMFLGMTLVSFITYLIKGLIIIKNNLEIQGE